MGLFLQFGNHGFSFLWVSCRLAAASKKASQGIVTIGTQMGQQRKQLQLLKTFEKTQSFAIGTGDTLSSVLCDLIH